MVSKSLKSCMKEYHLFLSSKKLRKLRFLTLNVFKKPFSINGTHMVSDSTCLVSSCTVCMFL